MERRAADEAGVGQAGESVDALAHLPRPRADLVVRPRLLDVMAGRFDRTLTVLTAGAGFGKSTLLTQCVHDPVAAHRGVDRFHRVTTADDDPTTLWRSLLERFTSREQAELVDVPTLDLVVDAMWSETPRHVALILDDVHLLAPGSPSWSELARLMEAMPSNAHLVLSGRRTPDLPLSRLLVTGDAVVLDEAALTFDPDELDTFARLRSVDRDRLQSHGWPALAELEAHAGVAGAHRFVAEEVLAHLDPDRVRALRRLAVHDRIDDELAATVGGWTASAAALVDALPLTSTLRDGAFALHDLWRDLLVRDLSAADRTAALAATSTVLVARGRLREATSVALQAGDPDAIRACLAEFARDVQLVQPISDRMAVIAALPSDLTDTPEALLVHADAVYATEPTRAIHELRQVIDAARREERPEFEALALIRIGDLAYRSGDLDGLDAALRDLERIGEPPAAAARVLLEVWRLMLDGGAAKALDVLNAPEVRVYPPVASLVGYYRAVLLGQAGRCDASLAAIEELRATPQGRVLDRMGGFASIMKWYTGSLTATDRADTRALLDTLGRDRQVQLFVEGAATVALFEASAGNVAAARNAVADAETLLDRVPGSSWGAITVELARAVLDLLAGDEAMAAARLEEVVPPSGPFVGLNRHVFGNVGPLLQLLVPRTRPAFDGEDVGPDLALATAVGRALVAWRERGDVTPAARLPWDDPGRLRTWAFEPHLAELALAATVGGTLRAIDVLDTLVDRPRATLQAVAERHPDTAVGRLAAERLAVTPERPRETLRISVLGPLEVSHGDHSMQDSAPMRRKMVRELLMVLVHRRRIRRAEVIDLLWPDKDESSGSGNLRSTLMHLRALVDVDTADDGPPWHLRGDGEHLQLFDSDLVWIDADEFERSVELARAADRERRPQDTLTHFRRATELYRGEYLVDASDPDWAYHHRMAMHLEFVEASTRCAELLAARGDHAEAVDLALRAVDAEPLSERAHRALIRALRDGGDRAGAMRAHQRVLEVLADEGLDPEDATVRLRAEL